MPRVQQQVALTALPVSRRRPCTTSYHYITTPHLHNITSTTLSHQHITTNAPSTATGSLDDHPATALPEPHVTLAGLALCSSLTPPRASPHGTLLSKDQCNTPERLLMMV
ncbi:hypothetical protein E2C01_003746 [Portunus trituberculatus]|uniref:Uncharacterized protein n=1 Tax=Portunus trituberculatus TaxID=210409 RepID=A0A5B7CUC9_PORTR|nr:hypothetical protein [Portunus trituberculatus]